MRALMLMIPVVVLGGIVVFLTAVSADDKAKATTLPCPEQLRMVSDLAKEYDLTRDTAIREKVAYKSAYDAEHARRLALDKQLAELQKTFAPKEAPKGEEHKAE